MATLNNLGEAGYYAVVCNAFILTLFHSERPKIYGCLAFLNAIGLNSGILLAHLDEVQEELLYYPRNWCWG